MSVNVVRLSNVMPLVEKAGGVSRFAERLGISTSQASHIVGIHPIKGIGSGMARRIEREFGLLVGLLDIPPVFTSLLEEAEMLLAQHSKGDPQIADWVARKNALQGP